jgi:hypothetical protein
VSKASDDLPDPLTPVTMMKLSERERQIDILLGYECEPRE